MCGLVGIVGEIPYTDVKVFAQLLDHSSIRGAHSTGIAMVNKKDPNEKADIRKDAAHPYDFVNRNNIEAWLRKKGDESCVIMGHTRYATQGDVSAKNAHPFQHGHITLAHNGSLNNPEALSKQKFAVDSEHVAHGLAEHGLDYILQRASGSYTFIWHDQKEGSFNIVRNGQRPLAVVKHQDRNTYYFASEMGMLRWILERNGITRFEEVKIEVNKHMLFDLANKCALFEVDKSEHIRKAYYSTPSYGYYGGKHHVSSAASGGAVGEDGGPDFFRSGSKTSGEDTKKVTRIPTQGNDYSLGDAYLRRNGIIHGQRVKVYFDSIDWTEYSHHARKRGIIEGCMMDGNAIDATFLVHNVEKAQFCYQGNENKRHACYYVCDVVSCRYNRDEKRYEISVNNAIPWEEKLHSNIKEILKTEEPPKVIDPSPLLDPVFTEVRNRSSTVYQSPNWTTVKGPGGKYVSTGAFKELTKDGCCICGEPIDPKDAHKTAWTDKGNFPICHICVKLDEDEMGRLGIPSVKALSS